MELIVLSTPVMLDEEASIINQLFLAGMKRFHLRKPDASIETLKGLLEQISAQFHSMVVLHQHHSLQAEFSLVKVHYPAKLLADASPELIKYQCSQGIAVSTSIHNFEALGSLSAFRYVFYSPVFDSISKNSYAGTLTPDFKLKKTAARPAVFALGGINVHNIHQVSAMGFDGAAVLGSVWNEQANPIDNFKRINHAFNQSYD